MATRSLLEVSLFAGELFAERSQGDDLFIHAAALGREQGGAVGAVDVASAHTVHNLSNLPILRPRMEIDIHAIDAEHCAIRWRMYSRADARVLRWTLLPLAAAVMRRRARVGLRNLARHLDTSSGISEPMNPSAPKV